MNNLLKDVRRGKVWSWDPFKDERLIIMPIGELLEQLAAYNPAKGLAVWFNFNAKRGQLQLQPVNNSELRLWWIEALVEGVDPVEYLKAKKAERKAQRSAR